jgi:alpha-glucuronidase
MKKLIVFILFFCCLSDSRSENGYELWLRYQKINNPSLLAQYKKQLLSVTILGSSPTNFVTRTELTNALKGLTGNNYKVDSVSGSAHTFIAGTVSASPIFNAFVTKEELQKIGDEGFIIKAKSGKTLITGNSDYMAYFIICVYCKPINQLLI